MTDNEAKQVIKAIKGLLKIAETAMPDTYYASDSRCKYARRLLAELTAKEERRK
jgi:hypothetical protein